MEKQNNPENSEDLSNNDLLRAEEKKATLRDESDALDLLRIDKLETVLTRCDSPPRKNTIVIKRVKKSALSPFD